MSLGVTWLKLTLGGTRMAVLGPIVTAIGSLALGMLLGAPAGYFGGWLDTVVSRWADLLLALPAVLLAIVVSGIIGGGYWVTVAILVVLFSPSDIRLIRGGVIEQKSQPYVEASRVPENAEPARDLPPDPAQRRCRSWRPTSCSTSSTGWWRCPRSPTSGSAWDPLLPIGVVSSPMDRRCWPATLPPHWRPGS